MNKFLSLIALLILVSCTHGNRTKDKLAALKHAPAKAASDTIEKPDIRYCDQQLEAFLDSIGHLPTQPLADNTAFGADSVFKSQTPLDTAISPKDFETLKRAARKGVMSVKIARRIFKNNQISYDCTTKGVLLEYKRGLIPVVYTPFNKDTTAFDEFSLCIGDPGNCLGAYLYFFKGNRIIAMHEGYNRFGEELTYYKDAEGKTVVYYGKEFDSGSGIWWGNYFFYKYDGNKLIPILNEIDDANLLQPTPWGGSRCLWMESSIKSTNPLTIKMVYHQGFIIQKDTGGYSNSPDFINDSTLVRYKWDEQTKTLRGQYGQSKITRPQILSYYLFDNERLFINAHYGLLKGLLKDKVQRKWTLAYLNMVKRDKLH